jgi:uncharacterized protein (DUF1778 family)
MKTGRPRLSHLDKKAQIAGARFRPDERQLLEKAASIRNETLSTWMRHVLLSSAEAQVKTLGK